MVKRVLWVVEIRDLNEGFMHWGPCSSAFLSRDEAREEVRVEWKDQGFETRIVKYVPEPTADEGE